MPRNRLARAPPSFGPRSGHQYVLSLGFDVAMLEPWFGPTGVSPDCSSSRDVLGWPPSQRRTRGIGGGGRAATGVGRDAAGGHVMMSRVLSRPRAHRAAGDGTGRWSAAAPPSPARGVTTPGEAPGPIEQPHRGRHAHLDDHRLAGPGPRAPVHPWRREGRRELDRRGELPPLQRRRERLGGRRAHLLAGQGVGRLRRAPRESLTAGARVVVVGRTGTRAWTMAEGECARQDQRRLEVVAEEVAPSPRWATANLAKVERCDGDAPIADEPPF
jgi:hypothetical protein